MECKEIDEELFNKYPELLKQYKLSPQETCLCWGILPGPGWKHIVEDMCKELEAFRKEKDNSFCLSQSKEKFGYLRVYFEPYYEEAQKIINKYEINSGVTCIRCGKPGTMRSKGWVRCHCDTCEEAYLKGKR